MSGPLSGIRVLDLAHQAVGPWACMLLGEMGADVVKVEVPEGDGISRNPPPHKNGITCVYISCNLNKRLAKFDFHDELIRETMYELVRQSDIVVENHRPGFFDRRGLGYEAVAKINPRIIYCSSSGYGSRGPYRDMGSADTYGQAIGGFASVSGAVGSIPEGMRGTAPMDYGTSHYIVSGVLAALYNREITGRGQYVETSQMAAATAVSGTRAAEYYVGGVSPVPMGSGVGNIVPSRAFQASDGKYLSVSALDEPAWQRLCQTLGLAALARDPRLQSNAGRVAHRAEVDAALEAVLSTQSADQWITTLLAAGVPAGAYLVPNNLRIHPQVRDQRMLEDVQSPWGRVTVGGIPFHFSRTPGEIRPTHRPGADNEEILALFPPSGVEPAAPLPAKTTKGPLAGLRVVDITQGYVGFCGMTAADLGARVIKVEPPEGDYLRKHGPPFAGDDAAAFLGVNRSKQSVCLAWQSDAGARESLDKMIAEADVLISDLQPAAAREQRLDYDSLGAKHPRLVLCSLTPFGNSGPIADQPATDLEIQAISGQWRFFGEWGKAPVRMGIPIGPLYAAIFGFHGTMAALYERARSGRGQEVAVSQLGSQLTMQSTLFASMSEPDEWISRNLAHLQPPARGYATADRAILWGFRNDEAALRRFCERLGIAKETEGYGARTGGADAYHAVFERAFASHTADELMQWVRELGGEAVPYHTFETLSRDPQAIEVGLVSEYDYPGVGRLGTTGLGWAFSNSPAQHGRPPLLGEHTREVLGRGSAWADA